MNTLLDSAGLWLHTIIALSWKGALLALIVGVSILLLRRRLSPAWRHGLWLLVLVRLAVPDLGSSPWSMSRWMGLPGSVEPPSISTTESPWIETTRSALESSPSQIEAPAPSSSAEEIVTPTPTLDSIPWTPWEWLTLVWLLGAVAVIGVMVVLHLRMRHRVQKDRTEPGSDVLASLREVCARARVKRVPDLIITDAVRAPALFGVVRPAILLPRSSASCDPASLKLILLHELAHLQRRDLWAQVAASLIIALHWFNPIVWWAGRRLRAEAEMAADARVLRYTDASHAHRMGEVLLGFADHAAAGWMVWFAAATVLGISENKRDLHRRIEALMDLARGRRTWWLMGLAAFVTLAITGLTKAPAQDAKKDAAKTTATTPAAMMTVKGIVVDDLGKPIPDARCYLSIGEVNDREVRKSTSDAEGRFRFESVPGATEWSLRARHSDFMDSSPLTQEFMGDEPKEHRIVLPRATGWLTGVVTRKKDGAPVKNASVYVAQDTTLALPMLMSFSRGGAKTDEAGRYRILKKSNDNTAGVMIVDAPGLAVLVTKFTWKDGGVVTLDHALEPDAGVSGKVVNADGKPVRGASVSLSNRMYMMSTPMRKSRDSDYYSALSSYWLGKPETDDKGAFTGRGLDPRSFDELRLVAQHPTEGFIRMRLKDWTPGGTLKLDRWYTQHGKVTGPDNEPLSDARMEFTDHQFENDADGKPIFSVTHKSTVTTDKEGRYRADQILPNSNSTMVRVNGKFAPLPRIPLGAGETREFDISFAPKDTPPPKKEVRTRKVTGRVILPSNFPAVSDSYEISVLVGLLGNRGGTSLNPPGADGRFESSAIEPGDYLLRIWLDPKDKKLSPVIEEGVSMIFKLEADAKRQALDLGEFKLAASDFAFRPAAQRMAEQAARKKESDQRINSPVAGGARFTSWTGGGGQGIGPEQKVSADGRIVGATKANLERFITRGTKADGSHHFTTAQVTTVDPDAVFEKELTFSPSAVVEGRMNSLPADYEGDGWVVASVWVWDYAKPGVAINGAFPVLFWYAWAPVQRDGKFRFAALPHGSLTLTGIGKGWSTRGTYEYNTDVLVNLMGTEPVTKLSVDTMPAFEKRVRLLHPDGNPAAGATITVMRNTIPLRNQALESRSHDVAPEDAGAYQRYKKTTPHSHRAVADAEGNATLGNLTRSTETCEVRWTDPKTKAAHVEKVDLKIGSSEALVVKLTAKNE